MIAFGPTKESGEGAGGRITEVIKAAKTLEGNGGGNKAAIQPENTRNGLLDHRSGGCVCALLRLLANEHTALSLTPCFRLPDQLVKSLVGWCGNPENFWIPR